jgi:hypothetical protein
LDAIAQFLLLTHLVLAALRETTPASFLTDALGYNQPALCSRALISARRRSPA